MDYIINFLGQCRENLYHIGCYIKKHSKSVKIALDLEISLRLYFMGIFYLHFKDIKLY